MNHIKIKTKDLQAIVKLMIVPQNISKWVQRSQVLQITSDASQKILRLNAESENIISEAEFRGEFTTDGNDGDVASLFVDCTTFRNLVGTLIHEDVEFFMTSNSITIQDGKSRYAIEKIADIADGEFAHPRIGETGIESIKPDDWQFIKDHMLFTAMDTTIQDRPMYQYVYINEKGTIIIGDFFRSIFSTYHINPIGDTKLIPQGVVNALCLMPEKNSAFIGDGYISTVVDTDAVHFSAEHKITTEEQVGGYGADVILPLFDCDDVEGLSAKSPDMLRILSQSDIVSGKIDEYIALTLGGDEILFKDTRISSTVECEGSLEETYSAYVSKARLRAIVSACPAKAVQITPIIRNSAVTGLCISGGGVSYMIGSSEA